MHGIIFYSKDCQTCRNLMTIMNNQGLLNLFEYKCIDKMPLEELTRMGIDTVPTLVVVYNENGKKNNCIYVGTEAFQWVNTIVMNRRKQSMAYADQKRKLIQIDEQRKRIKTGLHEYCIDELNGVSDSYSLWNDDMNNEKDIAQPKAFQLYGQDAANNILTIPENKTAKGFKVTESTQTKLVSDLLNQRKQQDNQFKNIMENEQIRAVKSQYI